VPTGQPEVIPTAHRGDLLMLVLGIDAHKPTYIIVAVDERGRQQAQRTMSATTTDQVTVVAWAEALGDDRLWAVEDCRHIGDRWDARRVTEFLDVSRQAVYKRVRTGSLLGLPGSGTTWFPVWQFDPDRRVVRRVVASIITQFRAADPDLDPLVIAAWVTAPHPQLDGASPADEIRRGGNDERVSLLAARAARGLAA
jgi:hypothetical protein